MGRTVPRLPAREPTEGNMRSARFWIALGCCGCLLLGGGIFAAIFGAAMFATRGATDAAAGGRGLLRL